MMDERKEFFKGTSRKSRTRKALAADYVKIDERSLPDLLSYAINLSEKVPFFDLKEDADVKWSEFFSRSDLVRLIEVSNFQIEKVEREVNDQLERLYAVHDQQALVQTLNELSHTILVIAQAINNLRKNLSHNEFTADLIYYIGNSINGELKGLVTELYAYENVLQWNKHTLDIVSELNISWGIGSSGVLQNKTVDESAIDRFKEIFHLFFYIIRHLMKRSSEIADKFLNELQDAEPHIALLLVFLKLFRHLQDFQNQLTERHLDFYYKDVLQNEATGVCARRCDSLLYTEAGCAGSPSAQRNEAAGGEGCGRQQDHLYYQPGSEYILCRYKQACHDLFIARPRVWTVH